MNSRPLSPHLQVYRLPLTALLSITHRMTGVVLVLGLVAIALFLATAAAGQEPYAIAIGWLSSLPGQIGLWLWIYALVFHACHGVRHLLWDSLHGLDRRAQFRHNLVELMATVLLTAAAFLFIHGPRLLNAFA